MLTNREKIEKYLKDVLKISSNYEIDEDGVVNVHGDVELAITTGVALQVQFGTIDGHFSFESGSVVNTFDGFPHTVKKVFSLYGTTCSNVSGIQKYVKHIGETIVLNKECTHLVGILFIEGGAMIDVDRGPVDKIMEKYVGTGDVLSAQDELIEAGLIEQARV